MEFLFQIIVALIGFMIVALSANQISHYFKKFKLPLITGLLITGIIAGPYVTHLIPVENTKALKFLNQLSLAFIAFAAGSELYLKEIRSQFKSIAWNTFGQLIVTFIVGVVGVLSLVDYLPFLKELSFAGQMAVAMLFATIFVARSPSSAIAVINELRAKGPFTQTAIGVTVVKDVLVIILFTIVFALSQSMVNGNEFHISTVGFLILELLASGGLGWVIGKILVALFKLKWHQYIKTSLLLLIGLGVYLFADWIKIVSLDVIGHAFYLEPLLICILASFLVTNYSTARPEFNKILHETGPLIYVIFFTLTGASLSINILAEVYGIAIVLFLVRLSGMVIGGYLGGTLAGDSWLHRHLNWMPYVTQAGVGLGLATIIANAFPSWGKQFETIVIAVIVINQIVGPPIFKWALHKVNETHEKHSEPEFDGQRDAIIFGYENMSLALARQLMRNHWNVEIVAFKREDEIEKAKDIPIRFFEHQGPEIFKALEAEKADAMILMLSDRENLHLCESIYEHVGTKEIIVRLHEPRYYKEKFMELGAMVVDPSTALVNLMDHFVRSPNATSLLLGMESDQDTMDVEVMDHAIQGSALRDLRLPADVIILSIKRKDQMIISHGYTRLRLGDIVTIVGSKESLEQVHLMLGIDS